MFNLTKYLLKQISYTCLLALSSGLVLQADEKPNILFITMDDMNYDSIGSYGCEIPNISPHIDSLADQGLRFIYAYNQTSSCVPSRNVYQTGRYPHSNGVLSFYNVDTDFLTLPELLKNAGYFTACVNKPRDTSITDQYDKYWDYQVIMTGPPKRNGAYYAEHFKKALNNAKDEKKPFYCVVNIADPHKPFYNDQKGIQQGFDTYRPSTEFTVDDVSIPAFLPKHPKIREEMRNYYNSVKRGDDCVGAVLKILEESGLKEDTVIVFISDHGMPLPYAKSSLYPDGLRTPWIITWPGKIELGTVDDQHLVSAIDFKPTILDIANVPQPKGIQGKSKIDIIEGKKDPSRDVVFAEFNDNAGGIAFPMRAVHTKDFLYVFNVWGTGKNKFVSAATWYPSEGVMKGMAKKNPEVAKRYNFLIHRCVEEFYDLRKDPHVLKNLIDAPEHQERIESFRARLQGWMEETDDYLIEAFAARDDVSELQAIYEKLDAESLKRAEKLQWKRYKNRIGGTGKNKELYQLRTAR
ncbi:MAG: sulfatase [Verrucomicrobiota bacterium]